MLDPWPLGTAILPKRSTPSPYMTSRATCGRARRGRAFLDRGACHETHGGRPPNRHAEIGQTRDFITRLLRKIRGPALVSGGLFLLNTSLQTGRGEAWMVGRAPDDAMNISSAERPETLAIGGFP